MRTDTLELTSTVAGEGSAALTTLADPTPQGPIVRTTTSTDPVDAAPAADPNSARRRRPRRRTILIAVAIAVVAAAITCGAAWNASVAADLTQAQQNAEHALDELGDATQRAGAAITGAATVLGVDTAADLAAIAAGIDQVIGADAASSLADAVSGATDAHNAAPTGQPSWTDRREHIRELHAWTGTAGQSTRTLDQGVEALDEAVIAWRLDQATVSHEAATAELDEALAAAQVLLTESEGRVLDDAARDALTAVIDQAAAVRATEVDAADLGALIRATSDLTAQRDALTAAGSAVDEAVVAWQAEQDRLAAEQAAAASAASTSGGSSGSSAGKGSTSSGGGSPSSSGSKTGTSTGSTGGSTASGPGGSTSGSGSDGSHWVETESGFWSDLCGDTSGNSWDC